ncbi:hypothetical protein ASPCAL02386 [Aspergillus calidoustus]|uniref:Zn(2)-C6 fungal-type domain-containing protein n=1 Tax=Aspergillus calidoustus TaxID=454130 RepID=A0A0U5GKB8_ASPCI|nr:hypothetical protein ASPCAL02386 [Aspergillus calidoustus]
MFECTECGRRYARQNSLSRHLHNHRKSKGHACSECNVVFYRRDLLSRHMKLHTQSIPSTRPSLEGSVANTEGHHSHRKRCHTACTHCRTLRVKCSGTLPCANCLSTGRHCDYQHSAGRISHPQGELGDPSPAPADEPEPVPPQSSPQNNVTFSYNEPTAQYQTLLTPDSALLASFPDAEPVASSPAPGGGTEPAASPSVAGVGLVTEVAQPHIIDLAEPFQDNPMLDLDILPWSLLHENLYLPMEFDFVTTTSFLDHSAQSEQLPSDGAVADAMTIRQAGISPPLLFADSAQSGPHPDYSINAILDTPSPHRLVRNLIAYGLETHQGATQSAAARDHSAYWRSISNQVATAFQIFSVQDPSTLLHHLADLYFANFEPLWPLFSPQNLHINQLHPLLFLVLTSIGAMYGDSACSHYGTMMHNQIRVCLAGPLELDDTDGDFTWLIQARSHTKVAALYFGQPKAFSFAQHLGALIVGQARRMDLFSSSYADACQRRLFQSGTPVSDQDRQALWLHLEGRRRLAFAIFRAETYTSVLLQKKPLLTMQDMHLTLPSCDAVWGSEKVPARLCLEMIKHDRTPSRHLMASDIIHIALEQDEPLPPLDPSAYEMLLFGLQSCIWRFSSDPAIFRRLTGASTGDNMWSCPTIAPGDAQHHRRPPPHEPSTAAPAHSFGYPELHNLRHSSRKMQDLSNDYTRLLCALEKCEAALPLVRAFVYTSRDQMSLMSSLILLHLGHLLLYTPIDTLHQIQYLMADGKRPDPDLLQPAYEWANSPGAHRAAKRAVAIWSLIASASSSLSSSSSTSSDPSLAASSSSSSSSSSTLGGGDEQILKFNLVAFLGLHHSAVLLWAYSGACESLGPGTIGEERGGGVAQTATDTPPAGNTSLSRSLSLSLHAPRSPAETPILIHRRNAARVLECFVWAYTLISPSRWSSFAKAATALSDMAFPSRRQE